jgi:hypothetical protein
VTALLHMLVAVEMLLLPIWAGVVMARSGVNVGRRLALLPAAVVVVAVGLLVLAAVAEERPVAAVLRAQVVALGFLVFLAGVAAVMDRLAGPHAAQIATALAGWTLVAGIILAGPVAGLVTGSWRDLVVRVAAHTNPLLVAERELDLDWLHQTLTYRLTPLGESYGYLLGDLAWWKTFLACLFVGSAMVVFSIGRKGSPRSKV